MNAQCMKLDRKSYIIEDCLDLCLTKANILLHSLWRPDDVLIIASQFQLFKLMGNILFLKENSGKVGVQVPN